MVTPNADAADCGMIKIYSQLAGAMQFRLDASDMVEVHDFVVIRVGEDEGGPGIRSQQAVIRVRQKQGSPVIEMKAQGHKGSMA